jgi:hypothetical protein
LQPTLVAVAQQRSVDAVNAERKADGEEKKEPKYRIEKSSNWGIGKVGGIRLNETKE